MSHRVPLGRILVTHARAALDKNCLMDTLRP